MSVRLSFLDPSSSDEKDSAVMDKPGADPFSLESSYYDPEPETIRERIEGIRNEFATKLKRIKTETLRVDFELLDGSGLIDFIELKKNSSMLQFCQSAREKLLARYPALANLDTTSWMVVKERVILPGGMTFADLEALQQEGITGPLYKWEEEDGSHRCMIVSRKWYGDSRHIHPANLWRHYSLEGNYDVLFDRGTGVIYHDS